MPDDGDAAASQGEDGLGVALAHGALAFVEAPRFLAAAADADERGCVTDALELAVVALRTAQVSAGLIGVAGRRRDAAEAGQEPSGRSPSGVAIGRLACGN